MALPWLLAVLTLFTTSAVEDEMHVLFESPAYRPLEVSGVVASCINNKALLLSVDQWGRSSTF